MNDTPTGTRVDPDDLVLAGIIELLERVASATTRPADLARAALAANDLRQIDLTRDDAPRQRQRSPQQLWRVRWWREGWSANKDGANVRVFQSETAARAFVVEITDGEPTPAGRIIRTEVSVCAATPWTVAP